MTSLKQIEANRRNALKSTGPRSENGKQRSRRNAVRHGLTAETTITEAGSCAPTGYYALGRLESATFAPRLHLFHAQLGYVEVVLVRLQLGQGDICQRDRVVRIGGDYNIALPIILRRGEKGLNIRKY